MSLAGTGSSLLWSAARYVEPRLVEQRLPHVIMFTLDPFQSFAASACMHALRDHSATVCPVFRGVLCVVPRAIRTAAPATVRPTAGFTQFGAMFHDAVLIVMLAIS